MRLLIKLRSLKNAAYDLKYYHKLRGFLYELQKNSKYFNKHDNTGYKLYSFSNLLPPKHMKEGDIRTLIISSPDSDFIKWLYGQFSLMSHSPKPINIGEMQFEMFKFKKPVCVHRIENGIEIKTVGSLWEFKFNHLESEQKRILQLGLESGLGELNSSGFGFMNVVKDH